ncbi:MAG: hypothetical protein LBT91_00630 [Bifidobacteriaceae bacterium]|jgi:hypothetical protein|nr:hypothetical protein [Bifidobacteriaceae bacterium]
MTTVKQHIRAIRGKIVPVKQHNRKGALNNKKLPKPKRFISKNYNDINDFWMPDKLEKLKEIDSVSYEALKNTNQGLTQYNKLNESNPDKYPADGNPFAYNCYKCVSVFELRRRGLKVKAKPAEIYGMDNIKELTARELRIIDKAISQKTNRCWKDKQSGKPNSDFIQIASNDTAIDNIKEHISKNYPKGEKRIFILEWRRKKPNTATPITGHTIIIQQIDGELFFIDPQTGGNFELPLEMEFSMDFINLDSVELSRIDNKDFDKRFFEFLCIPDNELFDMESLSSWAQQKAEYVEKDPAYKEFLATLKTN